MRLFPLNKSVYICAFLSQNDPILKGGETKAYGETLERHHKDSPFIFSFLLVFCGDGKETVFGRISGLGITLLTALFFHVFTFHPQ